MHGRNISFGSFSSRISSRSQSSRVSSRKLSATDYVARTYYPVYWSQVVLLLISFSNDDNNCSI